jgi:membrane protease YdiL (CAAX protease family)
VNPAPLTSLFLLATVVLLPWMAWQSRRALLEHPEAAGGLSAALSTLVLQILLLALALGTAWEAGIALFGPYRLSALDALAGLALLAAFLLAAALRWRAMSAAERQRFGHLLPSSPAGWSLYATLSLLAGFAEEVVYRGVLFALVDGQLASFWASALICSVLFGLSHMAQGRASALIVVGGALGMHVVVRLTGTLYVVMVVHAAHDLIAGWLGWRWRRPAGPADPQAGA